MKRLLYLVIATLVVITSLRAQDDTTLRAKFEHYDSVYTQEKIYLQTDRTLYQPNDEIWFKAWLVDGQNKQSALSEELFVELVDPKGSVIQKLNLHNDETSTSNRFVLLDHYKGGIYTLRCYTKWMKQLAKNNYIEKKITLQKVILPNVLMKVDFPKEAYGPGDTAIVEFSARTKDNQVLRYTSLDYSLWIKGKETVEYTAKTNAEGKALLTFVVPQHISSIDNIVNIRLEYEGKTESISRSAPIILGNLDIQFLPEGGNLVLGHPNRIAIKALNEFGLPADVEGQLLTVDEGKLVQKFSSYHQGMGAFVFTPEAGVDYIVEITKPFINRTMFTIPKATSSVGIFLRQNNAQKLVLDVYSPTEQPLTVFAQQQGTVLKEQILDAKIGVNTIELSTIDLPMGIVQLTVFDKNQQPLAERLAFVNKHRKVTVDIQPNKETYAPREQVKIDLTVKDETGKGVQGQFSMAVVDDNNLTFADDKQDNILSSLLLSSELQGEVYEPNFYFDPKEEKADKAIDYVMLTHGWRRFEWEAILSPSDTVPIRSDKYISGVFYRNGSPLVNKTVYLSKGEKVPNKKKALATVITDEKGYFVFQSLDITLPAYIHAKDHGYVLSKKVTQYSREGATPTDPFETTQAANYTPNGKATGAISGKIYDRDLDEGLPFANIALEKDGRQVMGTQSDFDGNFLLDSIAAGRYILIVSYVGFPSTSSVVFVENGRNLKTTIYITEGSRSTTNILDPATVSANSTIPVEATAGNIAKLQLIGSASSHDVTASPPVRSRKKKKKMVVRKYRQPLIEQNATTGGQTIGAEDIKNLATRNVTSIAATTAGVTQADIGESLDRLGSRSSGNDVYVDGVRVIGGMNISNMEIDQVPGVILGGTSAEFENEGRSLRSLSTVSSGSNMDYALELCVVSYVERNSSSSNRYQNNTDIDLEAVAPKFALQQLAPIRKYYSPHYAYAPVNYKNNQTPERRTDFHNTIYWNSYIPTDKTGKNSTPITYYNSDATTTFRVTVEGISTAGQLARGEATYATEMPFSLAAKLPTTFSFGDSIIVPITIKNNTSQPLTGQLQLSTLPMFQYLDKEWEGNLSIPADSFLVVSISYSIGFEALKSGFLEYEFKGPKCNDKVLLPVSVTPKGFPAGYSISTQQATILDTFIIEEHYKGSLESEINIRPSMLDNLFDGTSSLLREPSGCFEQVSSSNYPNVLALQVLQEQATSDPAIRAKALNFIRNGYQKLVQYEIKGGGFEWYGRAPAHEGLTAYGLIQFHEMQNVYDGVSDEVIDRTIAYLLRRKDGKGGFKQNTGKYGFSGRKPAVFNAYITWALSEVGLTDKIKKEVLVMTNEAIKSEDVYRMSIAALVQYNIGNTKKGDLLTKNVLQLIKKIGIPNLKAETTLTRSYGVSNNVETLSFAILALLQSSTPDMILAQDMVLHITKQCKYGRYGSTQSTAMALKALLAYNTMAQKVKEDVRINISINGISQTLEYKAGSKQKIRIPDLNDILTIGKNTLEVTFDGGEPLPFSMDLKWTVEAPASATDCALALTSSLTKKTAKIGETVRLNVVLQNKKNETVPSPMVVVGIPAGLSLQPWQLKKLQEEKIFDFYEIENNLLYLYYSEMEANAARNIAFDLKTELAGTFTTPASSAYLYYYDEKKKWAEGQTIQITP